MGWSGRASAPLARKLCGYCQVGQSSGLWQGLGHEHTVQSVPRLPLSG
jgi:hypothetical protein